MQVSAMSSSVLLKNRLRVCRLSVQIVRAVVVRTRKTITRKNGTCIRFDDNAAVLVNTQNNPRGTRVFGPIAREIRDRNFTRVVSLAPEVL